MTRYSILDLCSVKEGGDAAESFRNTMDLARHAERWGYTRFWLAEHHNMEGIASSATSVLVGYVAGGTKTIGVGSGGVMLPNHAPAELAAPGFRAYRFGSKLIGSNRRHRTRP